MLALAGPELASSIPLSGRTVIPGIIDAHAHMEREGLKQLRLSLAGLATVREILDRIAAEAARTPKGQWIVTMPVGEPPYYFGGPDTLAEKRMPDRHELDRAAPDHPVCISGVFGNWGRPPGYTALNTLALRLNGIDRETKPACSGVTIERDASGEPTGIIVEHNNRPTVEFDLLPAVPKFWRRPARGNPAVDAALQRDGHDEHLRRPRLVAGDHRVLPAARARKAR